MAALAPLFEGAAESAQALRRIDVVLKGCVTIALIVGIFYGYAGIALLRLDTFILLLLFVVYVVCVAIAVYAATAVPTITGALFHHLCGTLSMRFAAIAAKLSNLRDCREPVGRESFDELMIDFDGACRDLHCYNRFWKVMAFAIIGCSMPTVIFLAFLTMMSSGSQYMAQLIGIAGFVAYAALASFFILSAAQVCSKVTFQISSAR